MEKSKNNSAKKSVNLFLIITFAILAAAVIWFILLPMFFNSGSSLLSNIFSKKQELKLTAFSSEAFAYGMGDSSEVDGTTRVKGFQQNQQNGFYMATLAYNIDLVTPSGDTVKSITSRVVDKRQKEKMGDAQLDTQFDLGPAYKKGKYKLIYNITDKLSGKTAVASADFDLGD